jgi:hypothetical protein
MGFRRLTLALFLSCSAANAYSVLSHEALVDSAWDGQIKRLLRQRFPPTTDEELAKARAYAYGGCIIQDMGYYPFGNKLFSDLLHYVRPGDFIAELVRGAQDVNEYAFALGALAHYAADANGHKLATNRAVAILYPKLRAKFGDQVTYEDFPAAHVQTEFAFDVLQVSQGLYAPEAFHSFVGFEVSKPALERAFLATYGFQLEKLFKSEDLAIGTYRRAVSGLVPKMTKVALATREKQMEKASAKFDRRRFVYRYSSREYKREFGSEYYRPGFLDRVLAWFLEVVPKIGPFRALAFRPLTPAIDKMFLDSYGVALTNYRSLLTEVQTNSLKVANVNLDTGQPVRPGSYRLADEAYQHLAQRIADEKDVPVQVVGDVQAYFKGFTPDIRSKDDSEEWKKTRDALVKLAALMTSAAISSQ